MSKLWRMLLGFRMMALGMFSKQMFKCMMGRKVFGLAGWIWMVTWLVLWGNALVNGMVRAGLFRTNAMIDGMPPVRKLVECLVMDTWLHAL